MYTKLLQNLSSRNYIALMLIVALLSWSVALPTLLKADTVSPGPAEVQIVLSDSAPGVTATHTISFRIATSSDGVAATSTIVIDYQEAGTPVLNFDTSGVVGGDVSVVSGDVAFASAGTSSITFDVNTLLAGGQVVEVVVAGIVNPDHAFGATDPLDAVTHIVNVQVTPEDSTDTRVAIIDNITMTAAVDTIFEFSVGGISEGVAVNGNSTTGTSTPTSLDFGVLAPDNFYYLAQVLTVETNASNGFIVTVQESQELTSSTGEKIHRFANTTSGDVGTAVPATWTQPLATLNSFETYGHYGITTDDETLHERTGVSTDENFTSLGTGENSVEGGWVGNFHQEPRPIFGHTDAADGSTQNYGTASVGFGIEISSLQAAGNDYTNTLTYVATPTF
jgi:hypothetical protein